MTQSENNADNRCASYKKGDTRLERALSAFNWGECGVVWNGEAQQQNHVDERAGNEIIKKETTNVLIVQNIGKEKKATDKPQSFEFFEPRKPKSE